MIIGATACAAEMQGSAKASHVKEKLAEMIHLTETLYSGSISCSAIGSKTASGAYYPDPLLANCTKHNVIRHVYEIARLAHDVAGGILATMPAEADLKHPEIGKYVEKFLAGHDRRHRPGGIHAQRGQPPDPEGHVWPLRQPGYEKTVGQKTGRSGIARTEIGYFDQPRKNIDSPSAEFGPDQAERSII